MSMFIDCGNSNGFVVIFYNYVKREIQEEPRSSNLLLRVYKGFIKVSSRMIAKSTVHYTSMRHQKSARNYLNCTMIRESLHFTGRQMLQKLQIKSWESFMGGWLQNNFEKKTLSTCFNVQNKSSLISGHKVVISKWALHYINQPARSCFIFQKLDLCF